MGNIIVTNDLARQYDKAWAVKGLFLKTEEGIIYGLLGPNGAGKTSTVKMLTTLLPPSRGKASVVGHDVDREARQVRARIGYVPQEITSDKYLTGWENLFFHANLYHLEKSRISRRIEEVVELVELSDDIHRRVREYSGGMKKKLDIACGLINEPRLLFLDEPSLGLDVASRRKIWDSILALRDRGITIFMCTNYMDEADRLCDRVAIMDDGKIVEEATPLELKRMVGGQVLTLQFFGDGPAGDSPFAKRLARAGFVKEAVWEDTACRIVTEEVETVIPRVLEMTNEGGLHVASLSYSEPTLDDAFLKITGHGLHTKGETSE